MLLTLICDAKRRGISGKYGCTQFKHKTISMTFLSQMLCKPNVDEFVIQVRFENFTAVTMKNGIFWDVTLTLYFFVACASC
jgi:hypothetical protein